MNWFPSLSQRVAFWTLLPLVAAQGLWVRRHAPRFADAAGPASGSVGTGPTVRLSAVGDSIVAGVGAQTFEQALVGRFAAALAQRTCSTVEWRAVGSTGARAAQVRSNLVPRLEPRAFDIVLVSVGVNDVTGLVRSRAWTRDVGELMDALRAHSPGAAILMAGLPPLWGFPLLPQPLRYVFGLRARTFDHLLQQTAASRERCFHVPTEFEPSPDKFSADGYHPSEASYRVWGERLADWVVDNRAARRVNPRKGPDEMRRIVPPPPAEHFDETYAAAGNATVTLEIGDIAIRLRRLPQALCDRLTERYGKFVADRFDQGLDVEVCDARRDYYIDPPEVPESNPVHLECDGDRVRFVGYRLAGVFDTVGGTGRVLLARGEYEPADRAMENYIRAAIAWRAAERGGALVHAASAVREGSGYLFYGESGAGKSTLSECNRRGTVLSDDLSLVLPGEDGRLQLVGSPFRGTYEGGDRVVGRFPLVAGFRLVQDREAAVRPVERVRALAELVGNLPFVAEAFAHRPDLFETIQRSFEPIPLMHLHFRKDDSFWDAIRDAGL